MFRIELDPRSDQSPELEHACGSTCREEEEGELRRGSHGRRDVAVALAPCGLREGSVRTLSLVITVVSISQRLLCPFYFGKRKCGHFKDLSRGQTAVKGTP